MAFKSLKKWLSTSLLAGSLMLPNEGKAQVVQAELDIANHTSGSFNMNTVRFIQNWGYAGYQPHPFPPSFEIYTINSESNKCSVANLDLSIVNHYNCFIEGQGEIPDGISNDLAFKVSDFPSNFLITAHIFDNDWTNSIADVVKFYNDNAKDSYGFVHFQLPVTTNVSDRQYGNIELTFAPIKTIIISAPSWAKVSPPAPAIETNNFITNMPLGSIQNFSVSPLEVITNGGNTRERISGLRVVSK